ncbi:hypothetical protein BJ875DRAFT_548028 [Amylocarpus encephaloides]|uniref:Uncharacterized protein n=1 Tax=Amylocarpus encephaloides TaxID=45428 RepID=A0A9P7Y584_9HELO|nr:hypothetical protein BJ875DRAFT_548028 [Amylocarpus encephaloides]
MRQGGNNQGGVFRHGKDRHHNGSPYRQSSLSALSLRQDTTNFDELSRQNLREATTAVTRDFQSLVPMDSGLVADQASQRKSERASHASVTDSGQGHHSISTMSSQVPLILSQGQAFQTRPTGSTMRSMPRMNSAITGTATARTRKNIQVMPDPSQTPQAIPQDYIYPVPSERLGGLRTLPPISEAKRVVTAPSNNQKLATSQGNRGFTGTAASLVPVGLIDLTDSPEAQKQHQVDGDTNVRSGRMSEQPEPGTPTKPARCSMPHEIHRQEASGNLAGGSRRKGEIEADPLPSGPIPCSFGRPSHDTEEERAYFKKGRSPLPSPSYTFAGGFRKCDNSPSMPPTVLSPVHYPDVQFHPSESPPARPQNNRWDSVLFNGKLDKLNARTFGRQMDALDLISFDGTASDSHCCPQVADGAGLVSPTEPPRTPHEKFALDRFEGIAARRRSSVAPIAPQDDPNVGDFLDEDKEDSEEPMFTNGPPMYRLLSMFLESHDYMGRIPENNAKALAIIGTYPEIRHDFLQNFVRQQREATFARTEGLREEQRTVAKALAWGNQRGTKQHRDEKKQCLQEQSQKTSKGNPYQDTLAVVNTPKGKNDDDSKKQLSSNGDAHPPVNQLKRKYSTRALPQSQVSANTSRARPQKRLCRCSPSGLGERANMTSASDAAPQPKVSQPFSEEGELQVSQPDSNRPAPPKNKRKRRQEKLE